MEALLFMLNSIAVVVMVYMGLRDDRAGPRARQTSIFRPLDDAAGGLPEAGKTVNRAGRRR